MPRSPISRPILLAGLPRVWRGRHTLQLGLDPARAVLVELPDPRVARVLDLLDGGQPERVVLARAAQFDVPADEARALLDTLHHAGFVVGAHALLPPTMPDVMRQRLSGEATALALHDAGTRQEPAGPTPAQVLRRRAAARVVLAGRGRLAAGIAVALAQAGVGHVHPDLPGLVTLADLAGGPLAAADAGRPLGAAVAAAVQRAAPGTETHPVRRGGATLVVQFANDQPVALLAAGHAGRRQAHLAVTIREGTAIVGPLVPPTGGPCLHCLDLHRAERDADWPQLAAQLGPPGVEPCSVATVLTAVACATAEALTFLDGAVPDSLGAAIEIAGPGRFRRRTWTPHPGCDCGRRHRRSNASRLTGP
jgi:bacteriocin biosynthesis cyclodehydratase domain-containing protein